MAFPMYASAAWLVWVLLQQAGEFNVRIALGCALLVWIAEWAYGIAQHNARAWFSRGLAVTAALGVLALLPHLNGAEPSNGSAATTAAEPFSSARLAALRQEGKPVFVNITAAWCIACLVNERTTLSTAAVKDAFTANGVIYLKGDWTNQNPEIAAFLRGFNRDGLPFYAVYPAGGETPVLLPPVLSDALVVTEIQRAIAN